MSRLRMLATLPLLGVLGLTGCAVQPGGYAGGGYGQPYASSYAPAYGNGCSGVGGRTLAGGGLGAAVGGLIGNGTAGRGHRGSGTLAGIVAGGLLGGLVGNTTEQPCAAGAPQGYGYQPQGYMTQQPVYPANPYGAQIQPYASGYVPADRYANPPPGYGYGGAGMAPVTGYGGVRY